jgi:hypothetical protein
VCERFSSAHAMLMRPDTLHLAFNPKPFISTFETAVDRLIALRKDVQAKTEQMEKSVRVAEREYSRKMSDLNRGFEVCFSL